MQPQIEQRSLTIRGAVPIATFGTREQDIPHLFRILRSTLYSNKPRAVLREYFSNAWDAHRQQGIPDRPVRVALPTTLDPMLRIRDYGPGMSEETVRGTYAMYGASTKRADDEAVGYLGIGSKSAFSYTDSFTVTSWHGGTKSVYQAVLGESDRGDILLMHREACDPTETGIEISMAVQERDFRTFMREAEDLFQWVTPRPIINIDLPDVFPEVCPYGAVLSAGTDTDRNSGWTLIMGCVTYPIDVRQVGANLPPLLSNKFYKHRGILRVPIGAVTVSASRESLEYTPYTKANIDKYLVLLYESVWSHVAELCQDEASTTDWQRRLTAWSTVRDTGWVPPAHVRPWAAYDVKITPHLNGTPFNVFDMTTTRRGAIREHLAQTISVQPDVRLVLIPSTRRALRSYDLRIHTDYLVEYPSSVTDPIAALQAVAAAARITGIEIVHAQRLPHSGSTRTYSRISALDYRYEFQAQQWNSAKPKDQWTLIGGEPAESDVYVNLVAYRPDIDMDQYFNDRRTLRLMGVDVPPLIGYRRTPKFPDVVPGTPYFKWRHQAFLQAIQTCPPDQARFLRWRNVFRSNLYSIHIPWDAVWSQVDAVIGKDHPFAERLREMDAFSADVHKRGSRSPWFCDLTAVANVFGAHIPHPLQDCVGRYPLLCAYNLEHILEQPDLLRKWLEYIKLVDKSLTL